MSLQERIDQTIRNVPDFPKPGIQFKDISPILENPKLSEEIVEEFANYWKGKIDAIAGVESRGFLFGFPLAMKLGIPFILIRKKGKLPYKTISHKYDLEYGSAEIEMHIDSVKPGMRVLVHDDLLATGGTAGAAAELIRMENGEISGFSFLVELEFLNGTEKLLSYSKNIHSIISY
ncbi:MAG: adenine phosphoribosyltransferase [Flavobacteriales bacterium]|nr:adenine phosphoribosyltransferase [Flavobacteriales bacterium]